MEDSLTPTADASSRGEKEWSREGGEELRAEAESAAT
jgi:hypothetical protein